MQAIRCSRRLDGAVPPEGWKLPPCNMGIYPERRSRKADAFDRWMIAGQAWLVSSAGRWRRRRFSRIVPLVDDFGDEAAGMEDQTLRTSAMAMQQELRVTACNDVRSIARCFALVREASSRVIGMRHYDVQLMSGYALLQGMVAEMGTGEGKTLAATLAVVTGALAGWPVHVITVNDYLTERDAVAMRPLYDFFGLSVGIVIGSRSPDERRAAYACDITYCTNKELAFDYLRDRIVLGSGGAGFRLGMEALIHGRSRTVERLVLRGLHFGIVDEADSVLIDEARTPLIISRQGDASRYVREYAQAMEISELMRAGADFVVQEDERKVVLKPSGVRRIREMTKSLGGFWKSSVLCEDLLTKALTAKHLYRKGEHYMVRDKKVQIIDEFTGRAMPDRKWSQGIHEMIELREQCVVTSAMVTVARMTYQRFFRRYMRLAGMSGTCVEVARELWRVYRLAVARIPPHRTRRLVIGRSRVLATQDRKWRLVVKSVVALHQQGSPVLLGTRTVSASEIAAAHLAKAGVPFVLLNAEQDANEADIVAQAGQRGRVTIATNMSGRGTDISIGEDTLVLGGLHVIMSERHESRRIDRQLAGRAGRQGRPGHFQEIVSLDDPLMVNMDRMGILRIIGRILVPVAGEWVGHGVLRYAQKRAERLHARMRNDLFVQDEHLGSALAFSGEPE